MNENCVLEVSSQADKKLPRSRHRQKAVDLLGTFDSASEPDLLKSPDKVPAHIDLPPFQSESSRVGEPVMISVPVLTPGRELQRAEPPQVLGEFAVLVGFAHVHDTIDEALKV